MWWWNSLHMRGQAGEYNIQSRFAMISDEDDLWWFVMMISGDDDEEEEVREMKSFKIPCSPEYDGTWVNLKPFDEKSNPPTRWFWYILIHVDTLEPPRSSQAPPRLLHRLHTAKLSPTIHSNPVQFSFSHSNPWHFTFGQIIPCQKSFPGHHST